jgi:glycosyltransferase involved in cell wall biosynthesis
LRELATRVPYRLRVIGNFDYAIAGVDCDVVAWSAAHEARDLQSLDIGIYRLRDDPWTRGKAGLKIIQYQAAGLACVASDVPLSAQQLRDGETGLLERDQAQWADRLEHLLRDPDLRRQMGVAGRCDAVARYSRAAIAPAYRAVIDAIVPA